MADQSAVIKGLWKIVEDYNRQNFHLQELLFFTLRNNALIFPMSMKSTFDNLNLKTKDIVIFYIKNRVHINLIKQVQKKEAVNQNLGLDFCMFMVLI